MYWSYQLFKITYPSPTNAQSYYLYPECISWVGVPIFLFPSPWRPLSLWYLVYSFERINKKNLKNYNEENLICQILSTVGLQQFKSYNQWTEYWEQQIHPRYTASNIRQKKANPDQRGKEILFSKCCWNNWQVF